jgi:hypothetical protein
LGAKATFLARGILAGLLCFAAAAHSWGALSWDKKSIELTSQTGQEVIRTAYTFTNTGTDSVYIISVKPSCGCVATNLVKFDYAPGESGKIKVTFDLGMDGFSPVEVRTIKVATSDAPASPMVLQLRVHVPATVSATPEALIWHRGEAPTAKTSIVAAGSSIQAIKLVQTTNNENFSVSVKPVVEGQSYSVTVTPKKTDAPSYATLDFDVQSPSFMHRVDCQVRLNVE